MIAPVLRVVGLHEHVAKNRIFEPGFDTLNEILIVDITDQFVSDTRGRFDR